VYKEREILATVKEKYHIEKKGLKKEAFLHFSKQMVSNFNW